MEEFTGFYWKTRVADAALLLYISCILPVAAAANHRYSADLKR